MTDLPESLAGSVDGDGLALSITPAGSRSADEAVGFVLLPVLMVLVAVSVAYLLAVVGLALSGHDPALTIDGWRPGFIGLGVATWIGATVWYRSRMGEKSMAPVVLAVSPGRVSLTETGGEERWAIAMDAVARAEVRTRPERRLCLIPRAGEALEAPLSGLDAEAMGWLAAWINREIGRRSADG